MTEPDVVILGGGLAGLCLARQLLLETDRTVLVLERGDSIPGPRQKVGESTVQLAGDYLARVLDLEIYLLHEHFLKYNLRFVWRNPETSGTSIDDYSQSYIRPFSNLPSYQVDRNRLEAELARRNSADPRCTIETGVRDLEVELSSAGRHRVSFSAAGSRCVVRPEWVVDASGRRRVLARQLGLDTGIEIDHGSTYWWVDGTIDLDRLGPETPRERRLRPSRQRLGHSPLWLATNHLMGPGFWFWLIPLRGRTSLGLVYDPVYVERERVRTAERAATWIVERFPLLEEPLRRQAIEEWAGFRAFSHDATRVISREKWALTGEAGRFSDPLYSPGSDLIALHNGAIVKAIQARDATELEQRIGLSEPLLRSLFKAYEPSYNQTYGALGDQESFALKYGWELAVYFSFYVFPYLNDFFDDRRFVASFLRLFGRLGPLNRRVHQRVAELAAWKLRRSEPAAVGQHFDFMELGWLRDAERAFYQVGISVEQGREVLEQRLAALTEMARWVDAWVDARLSGAPPKTHLGMEWGHDPLVLERLLSGCTSAAMKTGRGM